jgi:hypothetical protein
MRHIAGARPGVDHLTSARPAAGNVSAASRAWSRAPLCGAWPNRPLLSWLRRRSAQSRAGRLIEQCAGSPGGSAGLEQPGRAASVQRIWTVSARQVRLIANASWCLATVDRPPVITAPVVTAPLVKVAAPVRPALVADCAGSVPAHIRAIGIVPLGSSWRTAVQVNHRRPVVPRLLLAVS